MPIESLHKIALFLHANKNLLSIRNYLRGKYCDPSVRNFYYIFQIFFFKYSFVINISFNKVSVNRYHQIIYQYF